MSKREIQEKELKTVLAKDIGAKNPIFTPESIAELHALFSLYADPRQRRADVREVLLTAGTLGLDTKYEFVFRLLQEINDGTNGAALDFEQFLKELTHRIVSFHRLRVAHSRRKADAPTSPCWTCRARASFIWTTCATSTSS
jgi:Ca2+-binding EF-hand superfamily protein